MTKSQKRKRQRAIKENALALVIIFAAIVVFYAIGLFYITELRK